MNTLKRPLVLATCMSVPVLLLPQSSDAFQTSIVSSTNSAAASRTSSFTQLHMKQAPAVDESVTKRTQGLSAVSIADDWDIDEVGTIDQSNFIQDNVLPVASTAMLITGNTIGAGMLVLPDLAAGPGMMLSTSIFVLVIAMSPVVATFANIVVVPEPVV